ncbi:MAG: prepilin-type N-terminal cleavage/methylation domain-containing protein [Desulfobacteraceae bacterium]|nr:prepilin-type N-terminal cleavage/methylation domain-containing protein [Desulfobacteraceae bacterium]
MHRLHDNKNGFTLLEILIAITVFSVGLLGMASLTVGIIKGNKFSNELTTATTLAQNQMEDIIRDGYTKASGKDENYGSITDFSQYKRVTEIKNLATDMKTVIVTVYWDSDAHLVVLRTILSK